jgi:hypothetical protein
MKLKEIPTYTWVAGVAAVAWVGSFGLRAIKPDYGLGPAADTLMATVAAWYVKARKDAHGGQDDLITDVVTKVAMPIFSTAHTPEKPKPEQPYTPKPAPAPKTTSKPTTPKPGGMPWGP